MKKLALLPLALAGMFSATAAQADDGLFTGDVRLACEAVLCLSSGTRPSECAPSLKRYFSISHKKLSDTLKARRNFLNLCPAASQDEKMRQLVNDISNGAGRCDAASLNVSLMVWNWDSDVRIVSNAMPSYCTAYNNNAYTDLKGVAARYVGTPERGGFWVDPANYEQALREYNERIAREDEERRRNSWGGGN